MQIPEEGLLKMKKTGAGKSVYFAAAYLRLSRDDGDIDGSTKSESNSISSQRELICSYIKKQDDMELFRIYIEM